MIEGHPSIDVKVPLSLIEFAARREGYGLFIPETFVRHIMCAFSYYKMTGKPEECIQIKNEYTRQFAIILRMINWESIKTNNPIIFAIRILKLVSKKINFRKLEKASAIGIAFEEIEDGSFNNYKFDLLSLNTAQLKALDIEDKDLDTVELSEDVQKLLSFYDGLELLEQTTETNYNVVKKQLTSYGDFHKGRRYKLILPTFSVDLGTKKLQITKVDSTPILTSEAIVALDCSWSMGTNKLSKPMIRSVLLYYIGKLAENNNLTVTLVYVIGEIDSIQHIHSAEELEVIFKHLPDFVCPVKGPDSMLNDLKALYPGRSVVLVSDGDLKFKTITNLNFKLYSLSLMENKLLKQMSLVSGGQFIILDEYIS